MPVPWEIKQFQNAISDLRKSTFSHWETCLFASRKSRSENVVNHKGNEVLFVVLPEKGYPFLGESNSFRTRFPTCGDLSWSHGKVKEMGSQNRGLEHICFPMETEHFLGKTTKSTSNHCDLQRFQNAISDLRKMEFSHWKS